MAENRGPDPDYSQSDELLRQLRDAIVAARRPEYRNGDDGSDIKKWIASVGAVLAAAFILGGWALSNQVASLSTKVDERLRAQDDRLTRIEEQLRERRP